MITVLRLAAYAAGAWICQDNVDGYWVVGPVFALVVILWSSSSAAGLFRPANAAYLAASTTIWAAVYHVARLDWDAGPLDPLLGSMPAGVALGSALLPVAHRLWMRGSWAAVRKAAPLLLVSFYAVTLAADLYDRSGAPARVNFLAVSVFVWQAVYLAVFFRDRLRPSHG